MARIVSLMVTLLVLAFVIIQLMGGGKGQQGAASAARVDEAKAQQAAQQVMQAAAAHDNRLNGDEGRAAGADQPGTSNAAANAMAAPSVPVIAAPVQPDPNNAP
jgi:ABC-type microcin C transport system permease subunit YejB